MNSSQSTMHVAPLPRRQLLARLATIFVAYAVTTFGRRLLFMFFAPLENELAISKDKFGMLVSTQNFCFMFSKMAFSFLSDYCARAKILSAGVFAIGVSMMMTAISASYEELLLAVFVNGCFQGAGWTPSTLLISAWSSPIEYGMWYSIFGISNTVSGMCLPYALNWPWRSALWYTGVACLVAFFIVLAVLSDDLSTPPNPKKEEEKRDRPSVWQIAQSPAVLHIAFIYCLPISMRTVCEAWFPVELVNANVSVVGYTFFLEAGGLVGTLTAGMINDSISRKIGVEKAGRYCAYATTIMMLVAVTVGVHYVLIWPSMIGFLNGCCLHSCILMWSLCSSRIGPSDIQGTAGAVVSLVSQSSSVLAGAPLSWLQGDAGLRALSPLLLGFVLATAATFQLALPISMSETPHKTQ